MTSDNPPSADPALSYTSYLALEDVLAAQHPRSEEHDELLFIVIHQVYELWFKQMLHELRRLQELLESGDATRATHTLHRILTILKVTVAQVDVLETMTPREFTSFRERLDAASGFQSAQFRELEVVLGRRDQGGFRHYPADSPARVRIEAAMRRPSLFDSYLRMLHANGHSIPGEVINRDVSTPYPGDAGVVAVLERVYRANGLEAQVAERLVDIDEGIQEWRYRHVKMVERTIGSKPGTGGSAGAQYLRSTLSIPVFPDLWEIRSEM